MALTVATRHARLADQRARFKVEAVASRSGANEVLGGGSSGSLRVA